MLFCGSWSRCWKGVDGKGEEERWRKEKKGEGRGREEGEQCSTIIEEEHMTQEQIESVRNYKTEKSSFIRSRPTQLA